MVSCSAAVVNVTLLCDATLSNAHTAVRASVMLKLPKLYKAWGVHKLEDYCDKMGVQARGAKVRLTYIQTLLILLAVQLLDTAVASALLLALLKPIWCSVAATPANSFSSVLSQVQF
eukprot:6317-Heterococcus_DN1.PRE.1